MSRRVNLNFSEMLVSTVLMFSIPCILILVSEKDPEFWKKMFKERDCLKFLGVDGRRIQWGILRKE